jgi:hypothetical protein
LLAGSFRDASLCTRKERWQAASCLPIPYQKPLAQSIQSRIPISRKTRAETATSVPKNQRHSTGRRSTETPPYRSSRRYVGARFRRRKSSALLTLASKSGWSRARCCSSSDSLRKRSGHSGHWRTSIVLHPRTARRRHLTARLIGRLRGAASGPRQALTLLTLESTPRFTLPS